MDTSIQSIKAESTTALTWLQKHERIVLTSLVLIAGSIFGDHLLNLKAAKDKQESAVATQALNTQQAKDVQLASQVTQLSGAYQSLQVQLQAENAQIAAAMSSRTVVLQQQVVKDKTLPLPDLGNRWAALAGIKNNDISYSDSGISVTDTGARQTVDQLEQVPTLTSNLADETTVAQNKQAELDKSNNLIAGLNNQITGLNLTLTDKDVACKAEVASAKADGNKGKATWFKIGFGTGFISGLVVHHF